MKFISFLIIFLSSASCENELQGISRMVEKFVFNRLRKFKNINDVTESAQTILNFLNISNKNQEMLLEKGLIAELFKIDMNLIDMETRQYILEIAKILCVDKRHRLIVLVMENFELLLSYLLVDNSSDEGKKLNLNILLFLEKFHQLARKRVMFFMLGSDITTNFDKTNKLSYCGKMEMVYKSTNSGTDLSSTLIRQLSASFAFQYTSSSVQVENRSKFFETVLEGLSQTSHTNDRLRAFCHAIKEASSVSVPVTDNALEMLLSSFKINIFDTYEVIMVIERLKTKIVGEANAKKVISALYPVFQQLKPPTSTNLQIWEIKYIMETLSYLVESKSFGLSLCHCIAESFPNYATISLIILDTLIQNSYTNDSYRVEKASQYIMRFHSKLVETRMWGGAQGTQAVMGRVVANHPKHVSRENMEKALDILNDCRRLYSAWK